MPPSTDCCRVKLYPGDLGWENANVTFAASLVLEPIRKNHLPHGLSHQDIGNLVGLGSRAGCKRWARTWV